MGFQNNNMRVCPYDWYQLAKFWLLADILFYDQVLVMKENNDQMMAFDILTTKNKGHLETHGWRCQRITFMDKRTHENIS